MRNKPILRISSGGLDGGQREPAPVFVAPGRLHLRLRCANDNRAPLYARVLRAGRLVLVCAGAGLIAASLL